MADPVVWFELEGSEPEQTAKFYSELFGRHTQTFPEAGDTTIDTHAGAGILGGHPKALWSFYRDRFGWEIHEGGTEQFLYGEVHGEGIGGGIGSTPDGGPHVNVYAHVDDLHKYLERAETLGGKTVMPPRDMQDISFAMLADPQGSVFGLYVLKQS